MQRTNGSPANESKMSVSHCRVVVFAVVALSVIIFSIYGNSFDCSWHFDDESNITDNPNLHLKEITWENVKRTFFSDRNNPDIPYRPIACLSFGLNYYFGELDVFGYHLVNILIHLLSAIFLFLFIYNTLNLPRLRDRYSQDSYFIALLSSFLWASNPVQTQAVTYIVQRMASMAGMFYIMGMYFYLKGRTSPRGLQKWAHYFLCLICGILAFGTKENAAMMPLSILLFDLLLIQGITKVNIRKNFVLFLAMVLIPVILALLLKGPSIFHFKDLVSSYEHRGYTLLERLLTEPRVIVYYITLLFYPMPNRLSLAHGIVPSHGLFDPFTTFLSILCIFFTLAIALTVAKKRPLIAYAVLFYFINHFIESSVFPLELIFEHRNYLPSMLLFIPVSVFISWGISSFSSNKVMKAVSVSFIVLVLIAFGHGTFIRNFTWKTEESLWLDAIEKSPDSARAHHNLGRFYADTNQKEKAINEYQLALRLRKGTHGETHQLTHYNLALIYESLNEEDKATKHLLKAIEIFPGYAAAYNNLSIILAKKGRYDDAYGYLIKALTYDRNSGEAHTNLGYILLKRKQFDEAISELKKALRLEKNDKTALENLGIAYKYKGELEKAARCFRSVLDNDPAALFTRLHLAETYYRMGKKDAAGRLISRSFTLFQPEVLFSRLTVFFKERPFQELPDKSIILPLLRKVFFLKSSSLRRMGDELGKALDAN